MKKLQILGTGCLKCKKLAENTEAAAKAMGIEYELEKVTDINEIMKFGVMMTPALAVDGEVKIVGKVPEPDAIEEMLDGTMPLQWRRRLRWRDKPNRRDGTVGAGHWPVAGREVDEENLEHTRNNEHAKTC